MLGIDYCLQEELRIGTVREYIEKHYGQGYLYGNAMEPIPSCFYRFGRDLICGFQFLHLHGVNYNFYTCNIALILLNLFTQKCATNKNIHLA